MIFFYVFDSFKNFVDNYDRQHFRSIKISIKTIDVIVVRFITTIQFITVVQFAVIEQLLLKILSNTKLIKQSIKEKREKRDKRDRNRFKNKFRKIKS